MFGNIYDQFKGEATRRLSGGDASCVLELSCKTNAIELARIAEPQPIMSKKRGSSIFCETLVNYQGSIAQATREAVDAAKKKYVGKVQTYNNYGEKFDYTISGNAIDICLSPKHQGWSVNKGVHLALAEHLDEVINNSIEVEEHPDYVKVGGKRDVNTNDNALMHRFYGVAVIDGKPYRVMTLMREEKNSAVNNGIHSYEVQKIEMLNNELPSTSNGVGSQKQSEIGSSYPLAKLLKGVEKAHDAGKNLLEESKKRSEKLREQRVFHGSGADFDAFDDDHAYEGVGNNNFGFGTYVTKNEDSARDYALMARRKTDEESDTNK